MVTRSCGIKVVRVTDAGVVDAFYVHNTVVHLIQVEAEAFKILIKTRPRTMASYAVPLAGCPLLFALLDKVESEPGAAVLQQGEVLSTTVNDLVVNVPQFEPGAPWRQVLPIGGGGEDEEGVLAVCGEVAFACEQGLMRAKRLRKEMPAEMPSDRNMIWRLFAELVKEDVLQGGLTFDSLGNPIVTDNRDRAPETQVQGAVGGQGAGPQVSPGGQPPAAGGGGFQGAGAADVGGGAGNGQLAVEQNLGLDSGAVGGGAGGIGQDPQMVVLEGTRVRSRSDSTPDAHPEVWQLRGFAGDAVEWQDLLRRGVVIYCKDKERQASVLASTYMAHGALQRYLGKFSQAVLAAFLFDKCRLGMQADVMVDLLLALDEHRGVVEANLTAAKAAAGQSPAGLGSNWANNASLRMVTDDKNLDETQKRERTVMQSDASSLQNDEPASLKLRELMHGLHGDDKEAAAGEVSLACSRDVRIARLLVYGTNVQPALSGNCAQELETIVMGIRSIMALRHERFVTAGSNGVCSDRMSVALSCIRSGKMRNLRLLDLLDVADKSTKKQPLAGLADHADADILIHVAIGVMATAWAYVQVGDTAKIAIFCNQLSEAIRKARADGVPWVKSDSHPYGLSDFMASVWRRVDTNTESLMVAESSRPRSPPLIAWIIDGAFEWVRDLSSARGSAAAVAAAERCTNNLLAEARKASEKTANRGNRQLRSNSSSDAAEPPAKKSKSARKKAAKAAKPAAGAASPTPAADDSKVGDSRNKVQADLKAKYGVQSGKDPCYFHFINGKCNFTADNCRFHHVG